MASFQGLNTAYSGMRASQAALSTISHNIANVGTEGYTRQRTDVTSLLPWDSAVGPLGSGVDVTTITRRRDSFLDSRVRAENSLAGNLERRADLLGRMESLFGQLDGGLNKDLAEVFSAFEDVAVRPDNQASREVARSKLEALAVRFNQLSEQMTTLSEHAVDDLAASIEVINGTLHDVSRINQEIVAAGVSGNTPNDLMDTRDRLLDELSSLAGVSITENADLSVRVQIDGLALVDGVSVYELGVTGTTITHPHGGPTVGGQLAGVQDFLNDDVNQFRGELDDLATELRDAFNAGNAAGFIAAGVPGPPLLSGSDAGTLAIAISSGSEIGAAAANPPAAFDGENAQAIADLRTTVLPSGQTAQGRFQTMLTRLGATTSAVRTSAERQMSVAASADLSRESAHGVVIDEEMAALVQYQRAVEAAARVMSTIDDALNTVINRMGRVGN